MTFLPVVERELRVASRRRGTYWGRFVFALLGVGLASWTLLVVEESNPALGADLFAVIAAVVFVYAAVAGTLVTCDCLSEEKREGTLGLLFLTDLKGHDVVLGKLAATSVNAIYGMLAVVPMLSIPFILGGVSHAEMLRVVLVSLNLLFFFLSVGLFASAVCRRDNWALGLAILIAMVIVGAGLVVEETSSSTVWGAAALLSSPATGCFLAFDAIYSKGAQSHFWVNAALTHLYGWIFFGLACWIVPRSWQDADVGKRSRWQPGIDSQWSLWRRGRLLAANPYLWRVARSGRKQTMVWAALVVVTLLWLWGCHSLGDIWDPGVDSMLLVPAGLMLKAWLAAESTRTLSEDRRSGGLELLLSTPLREHDIVQGQLLALRRQFAAPTAAVLLANMIFLFVGVRRWNSDTDREMMTWLHVLLGAFLVADLWALSWVGTWLGLSQRKPNRAALLALARILVAPVVVFVVGMTLWVAARPAGDLPGFALACWILTGLAADLFFGLTARTRLLEEFRTIASEGTRRKRSAESGAQPAPTLAEAR